MFLSRPFNATWPLSALLAWGLTWGVFAAGRTLLAGNAWPALAAAVAAGWALSSLATTRMRSLVIVAGFPASLLAQGAASGLPGWAWLLPLALVALIYPLESWRDAPLFPTPARALDDLPEVLELKPGARVLDAGCGLGHGLAALRRAYPQARLEGVECSWPLALLSRVRCPWASVRRADMWATSWQGYDLVYLFQRPESMAQALRKAQAELAPGAWLASLEFEAREGHAQGCILCADGRPVWLYRMPGGAQAASAPADNRRNATLQGGPRTS